MSLAVGRGAFGRRVFELDRGDDVAGLGIDRGERTDRAAVIREDDLVVGLVVHDAVETGADLDLLDHRQRLQIEHRHGLVAAVGREAVTSLRGETGAVHARSVRNVAEHFARGAFDHHHMGGPRHEHAARSRFDGYIVRAAVAFDIELFNLERLCVPDAGRGQAGCGEHDKCREQASDHRGLANR